MDSEPRQTTWRVLLMFGLWIVVAIVLAGLHIGLGLNLEAALPAQLGGAVEVIDIGRTGAFLVGWIFARFVHCSPARKPAQQRAVAHTQHASHSAD